MKRLVAITMIALMLCTLCLPAFAADSGTSAGTKGSITIQGASIGQTYTVYKMLELESFSSEAYSYKISNTDPWYNFFENYTYKTPSVKMFNIDKDGYVTTTNSSDLTAAEKADLAQAALAYANDASNGVTGAIVKVATTDNLVFNELPLGYYLVESTVGTLCGLTTTSSDSVVAAKNDPPTIIKEVQEDSNKSWGETNDESFYKAINFRLKVNVKPGAEHYVIHDIMDAGLELIPNTIRLYLNDETGTGTQLAAANYTVKSGDACTAHADNYRNSAERGTKCTFEIEFNQDFLDTIQSKNDYVYVYYQARLTNSAKIGSTAEGGGNVNKTWLDYGAGSFTEYDTTTTYTYAFDLIKTDDNKNLLDGAEFRIYNDAAEQKILPIKEVQPGVYEIIAFPGVEGVDDDKVVAVDIVVKNGKAEIKGLDGDTVYYLKETKAPEGYNILSSNESIEIVDACKHATIDMTPATEGDLGVYVSGGIQIVNQTGSKLPETGGMGTIIFIAIGSVLVIGTGIVLISKMRMSKYTD